MALIRKIDPSPRSCNARKKRKAAWARPL